MQTRSLTERCAGALALVSIAFVVAGTKACQEDYDVGGQASVSGTAAATPTDGGTGDDDDLTTRTPTPIGTTIGVETPEPTPEAEDTPVPAPATGGDIEGLPSSDVSDPNNVPLLQALSDLSEKAPEEFAAAAGKGGSKGNSNANWLGRAFKDTGEKGSAEGTGRRLWHDSDGDGFADWLESNEASDVHDPLAVPQSGMSTNLDARIRATDSDLDGLANVDERRLGTDPDNLDSDHDGRPDGAEVLSGGNPARSDDRYRDSDGDGLSDDYETAKGIRSDQLDSDEDGLRDDIELTLGSDPTQGDTDKDGVSDGKEFDLGSDPTIAEAASGR